MVAAFADLQVAGRWEWSRGASSLVVDVGGTSLCVLDAGFRSFRMAAAVVLPVPMK